MRASLSTSDSENASPILTAGDMCESSSDFQSPALPQIEIARAPAVAAVATRDMATTELAEAVATVTPQAARGSDPVNETRCLDEMQRSLFAAAASSDEASSAAETSESAAAAAQGIEDPQKTRPTRVSKRGSHESRVWTALWAMAIFAILLLAFVCAALVSVAQGPQHRFITNPLGTV